MTTPPTPKTLPEIAEKLQGIADQMQRAYGHLPGNKWPGPPGIVVSDLKEIAAAIAAQPPAELPDVKKPYTPYEFETQCAQGQCGSPTTGCPKGKCWAHQVQQNAGSNVIFASGQPQNFIVAAQPPAVAAPEELSDQQIIDRCNAAGVMWIAPQEETDDWGDIPGNAGFPGGFDMCTMDEMRRLLRAQPPAGQQDSEHLPDGGKMIQGGQQDRGEARKAFDEGYELGHSDGLNDAQLGRHGYGLEACWNHSETKASLSAPATSGEATAAPSLVEVQEPEHWAKLRELGWTPQDCRVCGESAGAMAVRGLPLTEEAKLLENLVKLVERHTDSWQRKDYGCLECTGPDQVMGDGKYRCALHAAKGWIAAQPHLHQGGENV